MNFLPLQTSHRLTKRGNTCRIGVRFGEELIFSTFDLRLKHRDLFIVDNSLFFQHRVDQLHDHIALEYLISRFEIRLFEFSPLTYHNRSGAAAIKRTIRRDIEWPRNAQGQQNQPESDERPAQVALTDFDQSSGSLQFFPQLIERHSRKDHCDDRCKQKRDRPQPVGSGTGDQKPGDRQHQKHFEKVSRDTVNQHEPAIEAGNPRSRFVFDAEPVDHERATNLIR